MKSTLTTIQDLRLSFHQILSNFFIEYVVLKCNISSSAYIVRALDALPLGRLSKQRMLALLELVRGPLCRVPAARAALLPHLAMTVRAMLWDKVEVRFGTMDLQ